MWDLLLQVFYEHTAAGTGAGSRGTQRSSHLQRHRSGICAREKKSHIKDDFFHFLFTYVRSVWSNFVYLRFEVFSYFHQLLIFNKRALFPLFLPIL